ncbi:MAG: Ig-like domain-containing protein, partial [Bacteroidota bacterium]
QLNLTNNNLTGCYDASFGGSSGPGDNIEPGGTTYVRSTSENQTITDFDPTKDKIDVGAQSVHTQIMIDSPDGLTFENMFNPNGKLILQGINLEDLAWFNFEPIADAHFQQDISAALAYENCTGLSRPNTVYVRSHEPNVVEEVDFDPATDKVSFFYLAVRGDAGVNYAVEQTSAGARFYSPYTNQSMTLKGVDFSELTPSHFEFRANQLEDNLAGRMGLDQVISNWQIDQNNVFNGKSVPMAGGVDRAPYHIYNHTEYTGDPICAVSNSVLCNFSNANISDGNSFDAPWEDFCDNGAGACDGGTGMQAPVVTINSPSDGANYQLGNAITITVNAVDNDGTISNLDILADDLMLNSSNTSGDTYEATWSPNAVGTYTISAIATDNDNQSTTQTISVTIFDNSTPQCNTADWAVLQAFYVATSGDSWTNNSGWEQVDPMLHPSSPPSTCDLGSLYGVSLDANGRVSGISLPNNNLTGKIPDEIGDLSNLTTLVLNDNAIAGALPSALARLTNLTLLSLTNNELTGCYDASLGASSGGGETLEPGGTTYVRSTSAVEVVTDFDPTKDKIDVGAQSVHTQIMIDSPDGLTFENMFNPN